MKDRSHERAPRARYYPKDWKRHGIAVEALHAMHMRLKDLSAAMDMKPPYVSSLLWRTRRNREREDEIARILGKTWDELFGGGKE